MKSYFHRYHTCKVFCFHEHISNVLLMMIVNENGYHNLCTWMISSSHEHFLYAVSVMIVKQIHWHMHSNWMISLLHELILYVVCKMIVAKILHHKYCTWKLFSFHFFCLWTDSICCIKADLIPNTLSLSLVIEWKRLQLFVLTFIWPLASLYISRNLSKYHAT